MHTPITALYAALLAAVFIYLSLAVIKQRRSKRIGVGDGGDKQLHQAIRVHGNFSEYVPLALLLLLVLEVNDSNVIWLHVCGAMLLSARIVHAIGLRNSSGASWQRTAGGLATFICLGLLIVGNLMVFWV